MEVSSRQRLIDVGMAMLLSRGYNGLGIADVLAETELPKGSFYHHFESKEDFALTVVDQYMAAVHQGLDATLLDERVPPLQRIRNFFEAVRSSYKGEGYLGCLLGGLGQELSGVNETFRRKIEQCMSEIANKIERCLRVAIERGDVVRADDPKQLAALLVNCWEGAALRTRLLRDPAPLGAMLDFYFGAIAASDAVSRPASRSPRKTTVAKRRRATAR